MGRQDLAATAGDVGLYTMLVIALMRGKCTSMSPGTSVLSAADVILGAAVFHHSSSVVLIQRTMEIS